MDNRENEYAQGKPEEVVDEKLVCDVFRMECQISTDPLFGTPLRIPYRRGIRLVKEAVQAMR